MNDCDLILQVLADHVPHDVEEFYIKCKPPGTHNWALRSRISNLRDRGNQIININTKEHKNKPEYAPYIRKGYKQAIYLLLKELVIDSKPESLPERKPEPDLAQSEASGRKIEQLELI